MLCSQRKKSENGFDKEIVVVREDNYTLVVDETAWWIGEADDQS